MVDSYRLLSPPLPHPNPRTYRQGRVHAPEADMRRQATQPFRQCPQILNCGKVHISTLLESRTGVDSRN